MHKKLSDAFTASRERAIEVNKKATNIITPSFYICDFVVGSRAVDCGNRLKFRWFYTCLITTMNGILAFSVAPLRGENSELVH